MSRPDFGAGEPLEVLKDIHVPTTYLRWNEPYAAHEALPAGRYVVDAITEDALYLTSADWDEQGNITFESSKHSFLIEGPDNIVTFKASFPGKGVLDWWPKDQP